MWLIGCITFGRDYIVTLFPEGTLSAAAYLSKCYLIACSVLLWYEDSSFSYISINPLHRLVGVAGDILCEQDVYGHTVTFKRSESPTARVSYSYYVTPYSRHCMYLRSAKIVEGYAIKRSGERNTRVSSFRNPNSLAHKFCPKGLFVFTVFNDFTYVIS